MFALVIGCALIPRFALVAALSERAEMLGRPVALAPEAGGPQVVGQVSGAAEAFGIHDGMRLGEALARCPALVLVPPDSERAGEAWERALGRLEAIGAAVESERAGEAFFGIEGLSGLWGRPERVLARAQRALGRPRDGGFAARLGAGPTRLCAYAAAARARPRRGPVIVPAGAAQAYLSTQPIGLIRRRLRGEWERASLPDTLERLGVRTLGELASLPPAAVADRFGEPGLQALRMASGTDEPLRPRVRREPLAERIELPEGCSGAQLDRALALLIDRLLANRGRRGRTLRRLRVGAGLTAGGSWGAEVTLREASAARERLRLALEPKLGELPGPAASLVLTALETGPPAHDQPGLTRSPEERRHERISEAVRQARAAAGRDAVMRVLEVEPASRLPERRAIFTPFPER